MGDKIIFGLSPATVSNNVKTPYFVSSPSPRGKDLMAYQVGSGGNEECVSGMS